MVVDLPGSIDLESVATEIFGDEPKLATMLKKLAYQTQRAGARFGASATKLQGAWFLAMRLQLLSFLKSACDCCTCFRYLDS